MVLLVAAIVIFVAFGAGLLIAMLRRDAPILGVAGMAVLMVAAVLATAHSVVTSGP